MGIQVNREMSFREFVEGLNGVESWNLSIKQTLRRAVGAFEQVATNVWRLGKMEKDFSGLLRPSRAVVDPTAAFTYLWYAHGMKKLGVEPGEYEDLAPMPGDDDFIDDVR